MPELAARLSTRPGAWTCLYVARQLLRERGWVPNNNGYPTFGPDEGPLCIRTALWTAGQWQSGDQILCDPVATCNAMRLLVKTLWPTATKEDDYGFVELGRWERTEGRTAQVVDRLFALTLRAGADRLAEFLSECSDDEDDEEKISPDPEGTASPPGER